MRTRMFISTVIFTLVLAACAQPAAQPTTAAPTAVPTETQVTITWLIRNVPGEITWETKVITDYGILHPNIKFNPIFVDRNIPYLQKFKDLARAGTPPDVWSPVWGGSFYDYKQMGAVADLTPLIQQDKLDLSDFPPKALKTFTVDGKIMGLPFASTGTFLFYNKDVFDKAGVAYPNTNWDDTTWNWDTYVQKCKALTLTTGDPSKDIYGCLADTIYGYIDPWVWGKDLFPDSAYQSGFSDTAFLDDPLAIQAGQAQRDLIWKQKVAPVLAQNTEVFSSGRFGMGLAPGWYGWFDKVFLPQNWGMAALPYGAPGRNGLVWTDAWALSSKSAHPDEVWKFITYLVSPQVQRDYMNMTGAPPARASLLEEWYKTFPNMAPEQVRQVYLGSLKYGREAPVNMIIGWEDQLYPILQAADNAILENNKPVDEILHNANQELIKTLNQIQGQKNQ